MSIQTAISLLLLTLRRASLSFPTSLVGFRPLVRSLAADLPTGDTDTESIAGPSRLLKRVYDQAYQRYISSHEVRAVTQDRAPA